MMNLADRIRSYRDVGMLAAPAGKTTATTGARRVLIVEDETIVQLHLRRILEALGYVVTGVAATAQQALVLAAAECPDAVLMDIRLPGEMDGVDAARELRALYGLPVVFMTAYADERTRERARAAGEAGYLIKPFTQEDIQAALAQAFKSL